MKKLMATLLSFSILFTITFATETLPPTYGDNFVTEEQIESSREAIDYFYQLGKRAITPFAGRDYLSISLINQKDPLWKAEKFPCEHTTYGASGCAVCCYTMVINYKKSKNYTPVEVGQRYYDKFCIPGKTCLCNANSETLLGDYTIAVAASSFFDGGKSYLQEKQTFKGAIISGKPVIIQVVHSKNGSHFVLAYGYEETGSTLKIKIRDPEPGYNYTDLDSYYNNSNFTMKKYIIAG